MESQISEEDDEPSVTRWSFSVTTSASPLLFLATGSLFKCIGRLYLVESIFKLRALSDYLVAFDYTCLLPLSLCSVSYRYRLVAFDFTISLFLRSLFCI